MANLSATGLGLLALALIGGAAAAQAPEDVGRTVRKAVASPIFTDEERAAIASKCGYPSGEWEGRNVNFNDGVLDCGNGKRVDDPEVRAIMARVSDRIRVRVREAMANAEVARSIARTAAKRAREALSEQRPQIARAVAEARAKAGFARTEALSEDDRARLRSDLERVRIDMQRLREELRREVQSSLKR